MPPRCVVHVLVHHPIKFLACIALVSLLSIILPFYNGTIPMFTDPTMGFETRGTQTAQRIITWRNFYEAIQPSGTLTGNPHEYVTYMNQTAVLMGNESVQLYADVFQKTDAMLHRKRRPKQGKRKKVSQIHGKVVTKAGNTTDKSRGKWIELHKFISNTSNDKLMRMERENFFCGPPDENYVQFVIKSENNLFNLNAILTLCNIEKQLLGVDLYTGLCLENEKFARCCRPWSLPNYIALLNGRRNCLDLTNDDVISTFHLLEKCAIYYHRELLESTCYDASHCMSVPIECRQYDAVRTILHFLTNSDFLPQSPSNSTDAPILAETMLFLPMARSIATLPFFTIVESLNLNFDDITVVAMDFGAKNELFNELLIKDTQLMMLGGGFVLFCIWTYTGSLFLTAMTVVAIMFSLGVSYFLYVYVYNLEFFPFMNLLAAVVIIGIGADDAFIFCKTWRTMNATRATNATHAQTMSRTLYHAFIAMSVTSITTAIAFLASYLSSITAIRCFGIFAGTAILMNYILIVSWLPSSVILYEKYPLLRCGFVKCPQRWASLRNALSMEEYSECVQDTLVSMIINLKWLIAVAFTSIAILAAIVVFYHPRLQIQRTNELQLFETHHFFEQYDLVYKHHFDFKRSSKVEDLTYLRFPLRFIWGLLPIDNGNYLNPKSTGSLVFDEAFNVSTPEAQVWLLQFCQNLRKETFYQPTTGAMLTNCFLETFITWMNRSCIDPIDDSSRAPCCNETTSPFEVDVFETCIVEAQNDLHQTPPSYLVPTTAGLRFTKTDDPRIAALVIEYDSNLTYQASYEEINDLITKVEAWFLEELHAAPQSLKNGFFITDLEFFDLQQALPESTILAVSISMTLAVIVLFCATWNILQSLLAIASITGSILTIMAVLVLLGWKLNILESVAISSTIGFAVDYSLHYAVNYRSTLGDSREVATKMALSGMLGPTLMGALTSGAAGACMMPSDVLAYKQIGQFLVIVTSVSWLYATFYLGALLAIVGPVSTQSSIAKEILRKWREKFKKHKTAPHRSSVDANETESLAVRFDNTQSGKDLLEEVRCTTQRHLPGSGDALLSQSPSNSAITFITTDDNQY